MRKLLIGTGVSVALAGAAAAIALVLLRSQSTVSLAELKRGNVVLRHAHTPKQRFAVLSRRHTNQCGPQPASLTSIAVDGRLQGSCCSPMNYERYLRQLRGLHRYDNVPEVPADPYDIPVTLAKQLIAYDREIALSPRQQSVYDEAVKLSHEHGPCCCHCWRWETFEGQAKALISRRNYSAAQIAEIWNLEDGCGGPSEST